VTINPTETRSLKNFEGLYSDLLKYSIYYKYNLKLA